MKLTKQALEEFKKIWKSEHNDEELTDDKALRMAQKVLRAVELIYKPIPRDKVNKWQNITSIKSK